MDLFIALYALSARFMPTRLRYQMEMKVLHLKDSQTTLLGLPYRLAILTIGTLFLSTLILVALQLLGLPLVWNLFFWLDAVILCVPVIKRIFARVKSFVDAQAAAARNVRPRVDIMIAKKPRTTPVLPLNREKIEADIEAFSDTGWF